MADEHAGTGPQDGPVQSDLAREIKRYHRKKGRAQAMCDAYGHRWPELDPDPDEDGDAWPEGFYTEFTDVPGVLDLVQACGRCGETRTDTLDHGFLDAGLRRSYKRPKDTVKRPDGYYGSRIDAMNELIRRRGGQKALSKLARSLIAAAQEAEAAGDLDQAAGLRRELADQL